MAYVATRGGERAIEQSQRLYRADIGPISPGRVAEVRAALQERLAQLAQKATGSSMRIARATVMIDPLDLNAGEVTDKGSVNQRAVLNNRGDLVRQLYAGGPEVILARPPR